MACSSIKFSLHGTVKMTQRDIDIEDAIYVVEHGEVLFEYIKDKPFPSRLVLGWVNQNEGLKPLHVVYAQNKADNSCVIITAYWPDKNKWMGDFKTKK